MIRIRPWKQTDIQAILAIEEAIHVSPWNNEAFLTCLQAGFAGFLATDDGKQDEIVGFIILSIHTDECHILNIGVTRTHQRQGIGKMLLNHALSEVITLYHAKMAYLEVRRSNTRAINLYKQFAFEQIGERKHYYPGPHEAEDALIFAKLLISC